MNVCGIKKYQFQSILEIILVKVIRIAKYSNDLPTLFLVYTQF